MLYTHRLVNKWVLQITSNHSVVKAKQVASLGSTLSLKIDIQWSSVAVGLLQSTRWCQSHILKGSALLLLLTCNFAAYINVKLERSYGINEYARLKWQNTHSTPQYLLLYCLSHMIICYPAWENRAYVHIKFDHFFGFWSLITLCLNVVCQWNFHNW